MKIYLMGREHHLQQLRGALELSRQTVRVIENNLETLRFGPPGHPISAGDLIIVTDSEEASLRVLLDNLIRQELPAKVMVFTTVPARTLLLDYPDFLFCDERLIYKNELRELQRKIAGGFTR